VPDVSKHGPLHLSLLNITSYSFSQTDLWIRFRICTHITEYINEDETETHLHT
jgi:hypothetical protein